MKRALENRFFAWLVTFNPDAPQWWYYGYAALLYLIAIIFISGTFFGSPSESTELMLIGGGACCFGHIFVSLGRLARDTYKTQTETARRLAEQDDRIRKLEAQVAALTTPSSSP